MYLYLEIKRNDPSLKQPNLGLHAKVCFGCMLVYAILKDHPCNVNKH